ncbi:MAG: class I SAM-dependent methyltransferase [Gammaproteobacteria bacterium]
MKKPKNFFCALCGGGVFSILSEKDRRGGDLQSVVCEGCGLVANRPIPSESELAAFYAEHYRRVYKKTAAPKRKHHIRYFTGVVSQITAHREFYESAAVVLDVGSGSGEFARLMSGLGKDVRAIEPTREYAEYTRRVFNLRVFCGAIGDYPPPAQKFDFIRLNHVLEHLRAPVESLLLLREWLAEDGVLHVEVPDFKSYCRVKTPGNIFHYGHIYNYDRDTLTAVLAQAKLIPVRYAGETAAYFKKAEGAVPAINPQNAAANKALYARHMRGEFVRGKKSKKLFWKISRMLKEQWTAAAIGGGEKIAEHYVALLKEKLASGRKN